MHKEFSEMDRAKKVRSHLISIFPAYKALFDKVDLIPIISPSGVPIPNAVVEIVIMQMLSEKAANTIYTRVLNVAKQNNVEVWELFYEDYREAGISKTKAETIVRFSEYYRQHKAEIEDWKDLQDEILLDRITEHKGLGHWTASIIALSHLGKEDLFPYNDGILKKAIERIESQYNDTFDPNKATPYRSYLALYLWAMVSHGVLPVK